MNIKDCIKFLFLFYYYFFLDLIPRKKKLKNLFLIENVESMRTLNIYKNLIKNNSNLCLLLSKNFFLNNNYVTNINELFIPYKSDIFSIGELFKLIKKYFFKRKN